MNHVEFELLDAGGGQIPLTTENIVYIRRDGDDLTVVDDGGTTLWFSVANPNRQYVFEIKTVSGTVYQAVLDWTQHDDIPEV